MFVWCLSIADFCDLGGESAGVSFGRYVPRGDILAGEMSICMGFKTGIDFIVGPFGGI